MGQKVDCLEGRKHRTPYHQVSNHIRTKHIQHREQKRLILFRFNVLELRKKVSTKILIYKIKAMEYEIQIEKNETGMTCGAYGGGKRGAQ
jgi:hypothetical protein